jgi:hypothetical protein
VRMRGGGEKVSKIVDIIFEVVFPEIAAHVPIGKERFGTLQVAPGLNLRGSKRV